MTNFKSSLANKLSKKFKEKGYLILRLDNNETLQYLRKKIVKTALEECKIKFSKKNLEEDFLNYFHNQIKSNLLNKYRVNIIKKINSDPLFKKNYFLSARDILYTLVGNELSMQNRINLSIQLPKDDSSLLPMHSDIWSGDSPFEVVVWIPLVDCYKTKTMYILPPKHYNKVEKNFKKIGQKSSNEIFNKIKKYVEWIDISYGEILIFNQALPHGNVINEENETRWSMNCRFKSIFSPYGDKKIGEFFEPITLRAASEIGMNYELPKIK